MTTATAEFLPIMAAAALPAGSLVVSIHDITPATRESVEKILAELKSAGVRVTSLLVVPDYHRGGNSMEDEGFVAWLRQLEATGHEIVIHGYFHERPRPEKERLREKLVTRFYTQDEGEFFDLGYDEAFARITRARDEFRNARVSPIGFVAPAWLLSREGERAARDAEMQYTTRLATVIDLLTGDCQVSRSIVYSTRATWRRATSLAWNAALARRLAVTDLVRLSIHPADIRSVAVWAQITKLTRRFTRTRNATTYRDWVYDQRINRTPP